MRRTRRGRSCPNPAIALRPSGWLRRVECGHLRPTPTTAERQCGSRSCSCLDYLGFAEVIVCQLIYCALLAAAHAAAAAGQGCPGRRRALKGEFQATVRSATSTLPFVSGLNSTPTRKMANPTPTVTHIPPYPTLCTV